MRLADFILENTESILREWEAFASSIWPGEVANPRRLRDHASDMLIALSSEMKKAASRDEGIGRTTPATMTGQPGSIASDLHAISRIESGFDLQDLVAEYRALRKNIIRLWHQSPEGPGPEHLDDVVNFNQVLDRLLAEAVVSYVRRIDQSREVFLAILGHDMRNPLQAVRVQASILAQSKSLDDASGKIVTQMSASIDAMGRMMGELLDFTGTQLGAKMTILPEAMDLVQLCLEVIDEHKAIHPDRTIVFEHKGNLNGEWDQSRLRQLISNLVGNALQHGCPDSDVYLNIEEEAQAIVLKVRNLGAPIPPDSVSTIFEPMMRRTTPEPCRQAGSIGLGLYIAREVARAHGGSISVHSTPEETVFTVRLPRQGQPQ